MKCPKCQFENREGAKFCMECGSKLELACPQCGNVYKPGAKFCDECGQDLREPNEAPPVDYAQPQSYTPKHLADKILTSRSSVEGERKVVTVFFADVANYTSMSEKLDPEEVHQIMDGCFKILMDEIHRYEGTINQFTGDGVMALFGAPVAHEDHAQSACHAALEVHKALKPYSEELRKKFGLDFKMRIGLNSGPVVVGSIGDDLRMDYTAIGDTTNLSARMESLARPGCTLVSRNTRKLARNFFEFERLGPLEVKGKAKPQECYELIRATGLETRIEAAAAKGLTKFVGRRWEIDALSEAFDRVKSGSGQVVGVVGEAGVGKSRLLMELRNVLPSGGHNYLEGRCLHYGRSVPYLPILDILKSYFEIKEGEPEHIIKKKIEKKIFQLDKRLKNVFPPFQELLSLKVQDKAYLKLESGHKRFRTFEAIRDVLVRESQDKPLVVAVEDLHWIDKTSEEFLNYLIESLPNSKILLIILYRPEYTHRWENKSYYSKIDVNQLSTANSTELVQAILGGGEVVPELKELVLGRAGGNPFFVEELTQTLLESGSIQRKNHQYVLTRKTSEIQVPDTIQGIIAGRMDRMGESLKQVIQVASVIGREFAFRILQNTMGMSVELKSYLLNLQGLEFISQKRLFPELEYIFKHALTQEVAYKSLLLKRRKELHEKIGQAIESLYPDGLEEYYELLAYHYTRSDNMDKAVEYLGLSSGKAANLHAMEESKDYFDEAMKLLDTMPETEMNRQRRISLLLNQWLVFFLLLKLPEYYNLLIRYESLVIKTENPKLLGLYYVRLGNCEWSFGNFNQAIQTLTKGAELCETSGSIGDAGYAYLLVEWSHLYNADYDLSIAFKKDALRRIDKRICPRWYIWALCGASWAYSKLGRWNAAVEEGLKALRVAKEISDNSLISFSGWIISLPYTLKGDLARALEYGEMAVQKAPTPADAVWAQGPLARALCRAGKQKKGIEILTTTVSILQSGRFMPAALPHTTWLGEGYCLAGEHEKARQTLEEFLEVAERCGARYYLGSSHRLLGQISMKTNPAQIEKPLASPHFEKSIAILRDIKAENELALAYGDYGRLHKQLGDIAKAREYLTKALEIFERLGTLIQPDKVREELAGL